MNYLPDGTLVFDSTCDMFYNMFMEMGIGVRPDNYIYDQDNGDEMIKFKDKLIKASIHDGIQVYAGMNDIVFEPEQNYSLMACLFGLYLDKCLNGLDGYPQIDYVAHYIYDNDTKDKQQVVVKTKQGLIASDFYYNVYLGYVQCIFNIAGNRVNLSNLDILREDKR